MLGCRFKIRIADCNARRTRSHVGLEVEEERMVLAVFLISHGRLILEGVVSFRHDRDTVLCHIRIDGLLVRLDVQRQGEDRCRHVLRQTYDHCQLGTDDTLDIVIAIHGIELERLAHIHGHPTGKSVFGRDDEFLGFHDVGQGIDRSNGDYATFRSRTGDFHRLHRIVVVTAFILPIDRNHFHLVIGRSVSIIDRVAEAQLIRLGRHQHDVQVVHRQFTAVTVLDAVHLTHFHRSGNVVGGNGAHRFFN